VQSPSALPAILAHARQSARVRRRRHGPCSALAGCRDSGSTPTAFECRRWPGSHSAVALEKTTRPMGERQSWWTWCRTRWLRRGGETRRSRLAESLQPRRRLEPFVRLMLIYRTVPHGTRDAPPASSPAPPRERIEVRVPIFVATPLAGRAVEKKRKNEPSPNPCPASNAGEGFLLCFFVAIGDAPFSTSHPTARLAGHVQVSRGSLDGGAHESRNSTP
jgi:hypothetical protein